MLKLALLGDPVSHSLSPRLHTAALRAAGVDGSYVARRTDAAGMEAAVADLRRGGLDGANVTMPHKALASRLVDVVGPEADRAASVNTLIVSDGVVIGESTDVEAIRRAWDGLPDGAVLLLGAGGAAAAAMVALEGRPLMVAARRPEAAAALITRTGVEATVARWGEPIDGAVVVNATPLGMHARHLPDRLLESAGGLFDMPYGPVPTPAVEHAAGLGIPVVEGIEMLLHQAALSFELWTGVTPSLSAMREAVARDHSPGSNL